MGISTIYKYTSTVSSCCVICKCNIIKSSVTSINIDSSTIRLISSVVEESTIINDTVITTDNYCTTFWSGVICEVGINDNCISTFTFNVDSTTILSSRVVNECTTIDCCTESSVIDKTY
jgi:hypothetical protein